MSQSKDSRQTLKGTLARGLIYSAPLMLVAAYGAGQAVASETSPAELGAADVEQTDQIVVAEAEGEGAGEGEGEGEGEAEGEA
ncbi:hypothetical protein HC341_13285 [Aquisalimonas sp. 2447]|uniref:hypothetical protein n=1 Tax=Aquisalimonas sp. 2447 TaxID=2740807 RepID=UPI0014327531|nr:hypothetical protein [Aquisalimonas sp. 2447]QIT56081.1 hypothetical protein HC341_13285 [Aquisalimonas sp. 2447]